MSANKITRNNRVGGGAPGPGRPKGSPNKVSAVLKDAILQAANEAGGKGGMVAYLRAQAEKHPAPFMALLGKVLPMQVAGDDDHQAVTKVVRVIVVPPSRRG